MRICSTIALSFVVSSGISPALYASSNLVGTDRDLHCGNGEMISCRDDEAIRLRFSHANDQSVLGIDFVLRGKNAPPEDRVVEVLFSLPQRSGPAPSRIAFQTNHGLYPLATNVDSRGSCESHPPV